MATIKYIPLDTAVTYANYTNLYLDKIKDLEKRIEQLEIRNSSTRNDSGYEKWEQIKKEYSF